MIKVHVGNLAGLLFALTICPSLTAAQVDGLDLNDPEMRKAIRAQYVGSPDLPDGIAYVNLLRLVAGLNSEDPETAEALVMDRMGLTTDAARTFIGSLVTSLEEFDERMDERGQEIACDRGVPRAVGDDAFQLLNAIDDVSDAVSHQYFVEFKTALDVDDAARLQVWVNSAKRTINHVKFDQKELARRVGVSNADAELLLLCNALENARGGSQ